MSKKSVSLSMQKPAPTARAENWVAKSDGSERTKRVTFEIPAELHARIKSECALRNQKMAEVFRRFIEREFSSSNVNL